MRPKLRTTLRTLKTGLVFLAVVALASAAAGLALVGWNEFTRARQLDRLSRETQMPEWLKHSGEQPLAFGLLPSEERVCVLHPYSGNQGIAEMSFSELQAVRRLDLPSEDLTWYLVAFQGHEVMRVLLIDEMAAAKLASPSMCFDRHTVGTIRVQRHSSIAPPQREVRFSVASGATPRE